MIIPTLIVCLAHTSQVGAIDLPLQQDHVRVAESDIVVASHTKLQDISPRDEQLRLATSIDEMMAE